jgi:uncharacterized membrane protein
MLFPLLSLGEKTMVLSMAVPLVLHILAAVIWVGGMFFAYMALRPAMGATLDPESRPRLWLHTLDRFFRWVWGCVAVLLITGLWMVFGVYGGMGSTGAYVHTMLALGLVMMALFAHVYFAPFRRLRQAVTVRHNADAAFQIGQIRRIVGINLLLGLLVISIAAAGPYF